jgi:hypothetical protein
MRVHTILSLILEFPYLTHSPGRKVGNNNNKIVKPSTLVMMMKPSLQNGSECNSSYINLSYAINGLIGASRQKKLHFWICYCPPKYPFIHFAPFHSTRSNFFPLILLLPRTSMLFYSWNANVWCIYIVSPGLRSSFLRSNISVIVISRFPVWRNPPQDPCLHHLKNPKGYCTQAAVYQEFPPV